MKIEIEVRNTTGVKKGSLPWLLDNLGWVRIGLASGGDQGAWLFGKDGEVITVLACRNVGPDEDDGDPEGPISLVEKKSSSAEHEVGDEYLLQAGMHFTEAALSVVQKIARLAAQQMAEADEPDPDEIDVVLVRVKDQTAASVAQRLRDDPAALPVLKDRLKETS